MDIASLVVSPIQETTPKTQHENTPEHPEVSFGNTLVQVFMEQLPSEPTEAEAPIPEVTEVDIPQVDAETFEADVEVVIFVPEGDIPQPSENAEALETRLFLSELEEQEAQEPANINPKAPDFWIPPQDDLPLPQVLTPPPKASIVRPSEKSPEEQAIPLPEEFPQVLSQLDTLVAHEAPSPPLSFASALPSQEILQTWVGQVSSDLSFLKVQETPPQEALSFKSSPPLAVETTDPLFLEDLQHLETHKTLTGSPNALPKASSASDIAPQMMKEQLSQSQRWEWAPQLGEQIKMAVQAQNKTMQIHLNPPRLGKVKVHLSQENGVIKVHFVAETLLGKELLETHMPQLKQHFHLQNLTAPEVSVDLASDDRHQEAQRDPHAPRSPFVKGSFEEDFFDDLPPETRLLSHMVNYLV